MKIMKTLIITSTFLASMSLLAQTASHQTTASASVSTSSEAVPYGDNPNIFKVLTHKAQQTAQNAVATVDRTAQKGIEKIRPQVATVWQETKVLGAETSAVAKQKSQQAAASLNQKINETKAGVMGSPNAQPTPIVSHYLSQSSTEATTASASISTTPIPTTEPTATTELAPATDIPPIQKRSIRE